MSNVNFHNITNNFQDARLVSLRLWPKANEIVPRDRGGPYVVLQEGYDPQDLKMIPTEFVIGRSGQWLPLAYFYKMPIPQRRAEFIFGTAAEVMQMMSDLPSRPAILGRDTPGMIEMTPDDKEIAAAIEAWKEKTRGGSNPGFGEDET
ncbi:MAG TPA: hypothetical protein VG938_07760 [Verrucomicrobiae bacterium]|jgi:hypothetical protein|nr:hypothetical protein [Verrucomicrobiae bacterium]